jgi:hypothetical protein
MEDHPMNHFVSGCRDPLPDARSAFQICFRAISFDRRIPPTMR